MALPGLFYSEGHAKCQNANNLKIMLFNLKKKYQKKMAVIREKYSVGVSCSTV